MKRKRIEVKYPKSTNKLYEKLIDTWLDGSHFRLISLMQDENTIELLDFNDLKDELEDLNIDELKNSHGENLAGFIIKCPLDAKLKTILLEHLLELGVLVMHEAAKIDKEFSTNYLTEIISDLLYCGHENICKTDSLGNSIIHLVTEPKLINELIKVLNINVNITNLHKQTPLHTIVLKNSSDGYHLVKELINNGADVTAVDTVGNTPLHYSGSHDISMLLLYNGADINAKNAENYTALDRALISCKNINGGFAEHKFKLIISLLDCGAYHSYTTEEMSGHIEPKIIEELNNAKQADHLIKYLIEDFPLPIFFGKNFNVDRVFNAIVSSGFDFTAIINKVNSLHIQSYDLAALYNEISEAIDDLNSEEQLSDSVSSDEDSFNVDISGNFDEFHNS